MQPRIHIIMKEERTRCRGDDYIRVAIANNEAAKGDQDGNIQKLACIMMNGEEL